MNKTFVFQNIRILYPAIIQPKAKFNGVGEEYSLVMLIPKTDKAQLKKFNIVYNAMVKEEFGTKPAGLRPAIGHPNEKAVLKDGSIKYQMVDIDKRPNYEAYKEHLYANLAVDTTRGKIDAVDIDKQPVLAVEQMPSGSYGHVVCELSAYKSQKWGPQFTVKPILVQVIDTSEPLGVPRLSAEDAAELLPDNGSTAGGDAMSVDDLI